MTPSANAGPSHILKRDGALRPFDAGKICSAIGRAGSGAGEFDTVEAARLTREVVLPALAAQPDRTPHVEQVQDLVEEALFAAGHRRSLRAFVVYREQHRQLRDARRTLVDVEASVSEYLQQRDWRVQANANQGYSLGGLILNVSGKVIANYWLDHVYPPEVGRAHREAAIHIHDLDMLSGYCAGWSLRTLLHEGLGGIPGKVEAGPARHLSSAVGQIVNFLGTLQNEWAGAQAFSSFDTCLAPFVRQDRMSYAQVRQCLQELIHNLNVPSRWGTQTPFTNLTFDWVCPEDLREQVPVIGGREMPFTYGELQPEMDLINRAYIEVMMAGDLKGRAFTFPIPTYNITRDFDWTSPNAERLFEMTARYGLPYFQNFLNSDLEPRMVRSMCCRLQLDLRELLKRGNGRADRIGRRCHPQLRPPGPSACGRLERPAGGAGWPARARQAEPGDQAQADPAPDGPGPVPLHPALPGHLAQPLLDAGGQRHQRDGAQFQRRRL
jgi:ribonucleoside-triphosphate reductase